MPYRSILTLSRVVKTRPDDPSISSISHFKPWGSFGRAPPLPPRVRLFFATDNPPAAMPKLNLCAPNFASTTQWGSTLAPCLLLHERRPLEQSTTADHLFRCRCDTCPERFQTDFSLKPPKMTKVCSQEGLGTDVSASPRNGPDVC